MSTPSGSTRWTIVVVRSGGFAGLRRQWGVSTAEAPDVNWAALIEACPWGAPAPAPQSRDQFVWRIEASVDAVKRETGSPARTERVDRRATVPESALTASWRRLIEQVRQHA